ncbi:hemin-degrading factor [Paroceanicella profunda]|uniref:Hemin-degrading factor n=1 Tax=Paroceanicella profunda TaxID=2579971 RepID=A0A5B8FT24_9RHOB|nr:ChuX/HutX family heme-like substrate-binding protein [Paroceanicella profunda]QDL91896.1 hemin-degrading factor [Paroceanicella profunda]
MLDSPDPAALFDRYTALVADGGTRRARDAAAALGVPEALLVDAKRAGGQARRLRPHPERGFAPVIEALPGVGDIMSLTRNEACVHERHGRFEALNVEGGAAFVLGAEIDLRLFLNRWASGFAVEEEVASGNRLSLQFFDASGTAIQKIYATDATDRIAFDALIETWELPAEAAASAPLTVTPAAPSRPDRPDSAIDVAALRADWAAMTDTHEFFGLLRRHDVGRQQALRLAGPEHALPLGPGAETRLLETCAAAGLPIMIFVGNAGTIQIHTGPVETIRPHGPWINVLDPRFNLHLRTDAVAAAWLVRKPTADGIVTSVELFDDTGFCFCMVFGARKPGQPEREDWRAIAAGLGAPVPA